MVWAPGLLSGSLTATRDTTDASGNASAPVRVHVVRSVGMSVPSPLSLNASSYVPFSGEVPATLTLSVKMEGGHYTFVEGQTNQMGESRIDRNVKKFFVQLHRKTDARYEMTSAF